MFEKHSEKIIYLCLRLTTAGKETSTGNSHLGCTETLNIVKLPAQTTLTLNIFSLNQDGGRSISFFCMVKKGRQESSSR